MSIRKFAISLLAASASLVAVNSHAANVTPDVIMGSGIDNGSFTVGTANYVEIGLRAKVRYPVPKNTFNYDGTRTYTFDPGESSPGSGRPLWNFEWSVNSDTGDTGRKLDDLTYILALDTDPTSGVSFTKIFDPVNPSLEYPYFDNSIGDNNTVNGAGTEAGNVGDYVNLIADNNVAQNSWAYNWFADIDPTIAGTYTIALLAFDGQNAFPDLTSDKLFAFLGDGTKSGTYINVVVSAVPLPAALPLYGAGLAVMGFIGWRRKKKANAA